MNSRPSETNYRWYVLALAALTSTLTVATPNMCLPALFEEVAEDLGLNVVQIGLVLGVGPLNKERARHVCPESSFDIPLHCTM